MQITAPRLRLNRRTVLAAALWPCGPVVWATPQPGADTVMSDSQRALHALNRLGYGPRPADAMAMQRVGPAAWLDQFLSQQMQTLPLPPELQARLDGLKTLQESAGELGQRFREARLLMREQRAQQDNASAGAPGRGASAAAQGEAVATSRRELVRPVLIEAASQRLWRALQSPAQLQERLVEFWFNHFNVFAGKGPVAVYVGAYERDVIRPHVLGRFRDMLGASAKHPAMLLYLDNAQSVAPGFHARGAQARSQGLNENYARELMELHTLGVDGGYSQKDVTELARMLTGWTLDPRGLARGSQDLFVFDPRRHDRGDKEWLGHHVAASGQREGEFALDVLASHPATARFLSRKFAQAFVADEPPQSLIDRLSQSFLRSGGDLRAFTETLIHAPEFWQGEAFLAKFKSPYQYLLSSLRALDAQVDEPAQLLAFLKQAGMPLYGAQTPDGYKAMASAWQSPEALTQRVQLASALAEGHLGKHWRVQSDSEHLLRTLGPQIQDRTRQALADEAPGSRTALLLASPDFMRC